MGLFDAAFDLGSDIASWGSQALQLYQNQQQLDVLEESLDDTDVYVPQAAPRLPTSTRLKFPVSMAQVDVATSGGAGGERNGGTMETTDLVYAVQDRLGRSISAKKIVYFILKYGMQFAQLAFGLAPAAQAMLVAQVKSKGGRRRGPHLHTVLKRIRAGDRYRKMLARYAAKAGVGRAHRKSSSRKSNLVQFRRKAK